MTQTKTEQRIQTLTMLSDLATELRELQDANLVEVLALRSGASGVIDRCKTIGGKIILAEERLDGVMSLDEWLASNVANLTPEHAAKCKKLAKGGYTDPNQLVWDTISPKQIEDKPKTERLKPAEWELAWGHITKLCKCDTTDWPKEQVDSTRDNLAATVKRFGGSVIWE
jgi:hypothetical protein